jgi:hypothetical protein
MEGLGNTARLNQMSNEATDGRAGDCNNGDGTRSNKPLTCGK